MKDKQIKEKVAYILDACQAYLSWVYTLNTCSSTDRIVENIIDAASELKQLHESQFEYYQNQLAKEHKNNLVSLFGVTEDVPPLEDDELDYLCEHLAKDGRHWSIGEYVSLKFDLESEDWNIKYVLDEYGLLDDNEYDEEEEDDYE